MVKRNLFAQFDIGIFINKNIWSDTKPRSLFSCMSYNQTRHNLLYCKGKPYSTLTKIRGLNDSSFKRNLGFCSSRYFASKNSVLLYLPKANNNSINGYKPKIGNYNAFRSSSTVLINNSFESKSSRMTVFQYSSSSTDNNNSVQIGSLQLKKNEKLIEAKDGLIEGIQETKAKVKEKMNEIIEVNFEFFVSII